MKFEMKFNGNSVEKRLKFNGNSVENKKMW